MTSTLFGVHVGWHKHEKENIHIVCPNIFGILTIWSNLNNIISFCYENIARHLYANTDDYNLATRYKRNLNGHVVFLLYHLTVSRRKTGEPQGSPISHISFNATITWVQICILSFPGILLQ